MNFYFASRAGNLRYIRAGSDLSIWPHIVHNLNRYHVRTGKNWKNEDLSEDYLLTPIIKFKKGREPSGVPYLYTGTIPDKNLIVDNNFPYQFKNKNRIRVEKMPISQHLLLINLSESIQEFFLEVCKKE